MRILFLVNELLTVCGVSKHFYYLLKGLKEYYPDNDYFVITGGGDAIRKFSEIGVPIYINKNIRHESRSYKGYVKAIYDIYRFKNKNKIDIIHSHHHYCASIASKISKFTKVKTILTNHGILQKQRLLSHFSSHNIIVLTKDIETYLNKKFSNKKNIFLLSHGFSIPQNTKRESNNKLIRILLASRIEKEKGFDVFLESMLYLDKHLLRNVKIRIAGIGSYLYELKKIVKKNNLPVIFLGKIDNMGELLQNNEVFIFPSIAKYEGLPTVLIEAGINKNIIISSNFINSNNFLKDGKNSILFSQGNSTQLAEKIKLIIQRFEDYQFLAENVYNDFIKKYNIELSSKELLNIYEKILDE